MAIKIGGTTVIDNSRNLNAGVGTFYDIDFPISINTFKPTIGETNVAITTNIVITFNQTVGISSSAANITIRQDSPSGTAISTIGVTSSSVTISGAQVTIDPPVNLGYGKTYYPVIDAGAFEHTFGSVSAALTTYYFTSKVINLGDTIEGGQVMCKTGAGIAWIAAPASSEVSRSWYSRGDARITACQATGIATSQWFIPDVSQLQNPGFTCRAYWDESVGFTYWSNQQSLNANCGCNVSMSNGAGGTQGATILFCVRAFRCFSY